MAKNQKQKGKLNEVNFVEADNLILEAEDIRVEETSDSSCLLAEEKCTFTIDSGCTSTMVRSAELLQGLKKASGKVRLGGSGSEIPVNGTGNFQLSLSSGKIQNIAGALFVPDLCKDLLSVAQITDAKMKVVFDASGVHLYQESAKVDGVSVASGTRRGNLYEIEIPVAMEEKALIAEVDKNALLWHCRLGHVGEQALQRLLKENMDVVFNEEKFPGPKPTDADFILEEILPPVRSEIEIGVMLSTSRTRVIGEKTEGADCSTDQVPTRDSSNQEEVETEVLPPLDVTTELDQFEQTAIQGDWAEGHTPILPKEAVIVPLPLGLLVAGVLNFITLHSQAKALQSEMKKAKVNEMLLSPFLRTGKKNSPFPFRPRTIAERGRKARTPEYVTSTFCRFLFFPSRSDRRGKGEKAPASLTFYRWSYPVPVSTRKRNKKVPTKHTSGSKKKRRADEERRAAELLLASVGIEEKEVLFILLAGCQRGFRKIGREIDNLLGSQQQQERRKRRKFLLVWWDIVKMGFLFGPKGYDDEPPRDPSLQINSKEPFNAEPPPSALVKSFITPVEMFYKRNHGPIPVLTNQASYRLEITGLAPKTLSLSMDEIRSLEKHTVVVTLQCAGNRRTAMSQKRTVKGVGWGIAALGNAVWGGARLSDVLALVGIPSYTKSTASGGKHVEFISVDQCPEEKGGPYRASIPLFQATDPEADVLLAYEMNGQELKRDHGYPLRVVVPGIIGARSVKWISSIDISPIECQGFFQQRDYKIFPPWVNWDNIVWSSRRPLMDFPVQCAICTPSEGSILKAGSVVKISGYALSGGGRGIERVDVSVDGGHSWKEATRTQKGVSTSSNLYISDVEENCDKWAWVLWELNTTLAPPATIIAKAVDSAANVQPATVEEVWNLRGVLNNSWHEVHVKAESQVSGSSRL
ncbi:hypothetical protein R1flu_029024 [Riccia fluitans]|uniref:Sulfite oxidase n=1 Tax=Riccia fluitans TaxID=41844 RepID=A0ABD1XRC1_9MARC